MTVRATRAVLLFVLIFVALACLSGTSVTQDVDVVIVADHNPAVDNVVAALEEQGYTVKTEHYPTVLVQQAASAAVTEYPEKFIVLVTDAYHLRVPNPAYSVYMQMGSAFDPTVFICAGRTPPSDWESYDRLGVMAPAFGISGAGAMGSWVMNTEDAPQYVTADMIQGAEFPFIYAGTQDALLAGLGTDYDCAITTASAAGSHPTALVPNSLAINYGAILVGGDPWRTGTLDNLDRLQTALQQGVEASDAELTSASNDFFFLPGNTLQAVERYWRSERGETTFAAVIDLSGSMDEGMGGMGSKSRIDALRDDFSQLLRYYPFDFTTERFDIYYFSNSVEHVPVVAASQLSEAQKRAAGLSARGYTALYDAIYTALSEQPHFLLVLSDGQDTSSSHTQDDVCRLAASRDTQLLGVAYGEGQRELSALRDCMGGTVVEGGEGVVLESMLQLFGSWK